MMHFPVFRSLFSRIGLITVLVVAISMVSLGLYYSARFSSEIDSSILERIQLPGALMNRQVLRYDTVASKELMTELLGDEFVDGMVVGADGDIYYAFRPEMVGKSFRDMPPAATFALGERINAPVIMSLEEDGENYLSCITPIVAFEGADPFFYALVTIRTTASEKAKRDIFYLFLIGGALCSILASAAIMGFTRTFIISPVAELEKSARRLARGDLDTDIHVSRTGELSSLAHSFEAMRDALRGNIRELRRKEKRLTALVGALPDVVLVQDQEGRYLEVFTSEENLLYEDMRNLVGARVQDLFPPDQARSFLEVLEKTVETGRSQTLEYGLEVQAGYRWFEGRSSLIPADEEHSALMVFVARDVTNRKTMEETLRMAKEEAEALAGKLMEMDAAKSAFLSSVSHELRTPLTSLLGFSRMIQKDFSRYFNPLSRGDEQLERRAGRIEENLKVIGLEGERLTRLITNVLDLGRIETGHMKWNDELLDSGAVIEHAFHVAGGQYAFKPEVRPVLEMDPDLPKIMADPDRIQQVLINLMDNAAKFTHQGQVVLRAGRTDEGSLRIEVEDTGEGIPGDQLATIFEKYHQSGAGDTVKNRAGGTGLGLAICREIVQNYGGEIDAASMPGKGSVFSIILPAAEGDGS